VLYLGYDDEDSADAVGKVSCVVGCGVVVLEVARGSRGSLGLRLKWDGESSSHIISHRGGIYYECHI